MRHLAIALGLALSTALAAMAQTAPAEKPGQPAAASSPGQQTTTAKEQSSQSTAQKVATDTTPDLEVTGVEYPPGATTPSEVKRRSAKLVSLGESIVITFDHDKLQKYLTFAATQQKEVTLYLNGKDSSLSPEVKNPEDGKLQYHLERNPDNKTLWASLLRNPSDHDKPRIIKVSVAISGTSAVKATAGANNYFNFGVVRMTWDSWLGLIVLVSMLIVFFWLAKRFCLLCDGPNGLYSLGRCQMAWWFLLILIGYVLIWLISGDRDTLTATLLGLMGISAATGLGAVMIETNVGSAAAQGAPGPAAPALSAAAQTARAATPLALRWLRDILSDSDGNIVLHRFQAVAWTVVLGFIFAVSVVKELTMPEFNSNLLIAMGISGGTYLGFKFPEK